MNELDNKYRKFLGLSEVLPSWTRIEACNEVFYHDGKSLLKEIRNDKDGYFECDLNEPLPEKFNRTVIEKFKTNIYFLYSCPHIKISLPSNSAEENGDLEGSYTISIKERNRKSLWLVRTMV